MRRQLCDEHVAVENQAAHLEDAMLRRLSKRRLTRLEADIRLIEGRLAEMVATNAAFARLYDLLTSMPGVGAVLACQMDAGPVSARGTSARCPEARDQRRRCGAIQNSRGACLAGAVVIDTMLPGVVKLSRGAWYDPAGAEDGAVCVHGNANVLRHDRGTLKLSQGPSSGTNMVEIECWKEPLPPVRAFEPPEVVPGITNSPWTGLQLYGHHNPGSVEYF